MSATGFDAAAARRWSAGAVPGWVPRGALVAGWAAALAVAVFGDVPPCTPADPSVCGPDRHFAVAFGLCLATPVLLLLLPAAGCAAGALFAVDEVLSDPLRSAATAFGLHGAACVAVLGLLVAARTRQARVAGEMARPGTATPTRPPPVPPGWRLTAAGLLVLGVLALLFFLHDQGEADRHLAAATREPARVTAVDRENWTVSVLVAGADDPVAIDVVDPDPYAAGTDVPVLVDRTGRPPWVAVVSEQPDVTLWLSGAVLAALLAAAVATWDLDRRRAVRRLAAGPAATIEVWVEPDGEDAVLLPAGGGPPFARVALAEPMDPELPDPSWMDDEDAWRARFHLDGTDELTAEQVEEFGRTWRSGEPSPTRRRPPVRATAAGDLRVGGWVVLRTAERTWWPAGPVRRPRPAFSWQRLNGGEPDEPGPIPGRPVAPAETVPELPLVARPHAGTRLVGAALLAGAALCLLYVLTVAEGWYETGLALLLGGRLAWEGTDRLPAWVRLERTALVFFGRWQTIRVPWSLVHGVRRDRTMLAIAWAPEDVIEFGPFPSRPGRPGDEAAERVGAAAMALRALAAGDPGGEVSRTWSVATGVLALYVVAAVLVVVL